MIASARARRIRWLCTGVLIAAALAVPEAREYQTIDDVESLHIVFDTDWAPRAAPGYVPARFEITNSGPDRVIEIVAQGTRTYTRTTVTVAAGQGSTFLRQSIRLAAGDQVRLTIPVPVYGDYEEIRFEIRQGSRVVHRFSYGSVRGRAPLAAASTLVVISPGGPLEGFALRATRAPGPPGARGSSYVVLPPGASGTAGRIISTGPMGPAVDFQLEPARLPANWLGYTSLRAVALGVTEWEQLTDGQKSALLSWTASGGDLFFVGGDIKTLLPSAEARTAGERSTARHLMGRVHAVPLGVVTAGLGKVLAETETEREPFLSMPINSAADWGLIERRGFRLRIPGVDGVPARVYLGILLIFAVIIGPVNYIFLRRRKQEVIVVLTAPVISAIFIALLAGYAVAGEGFRVKGRAVTFTMLDQVTKQAVTRASVSLYAPGLTPGSGLRFGRDVAVFAIGTDGDGMRGRMEMDLSDTQHVSAGVLQARAPSNFEQVTVRAARERLTFAPAADGLAVSNGLDATILALIYRDATATYSLSGQLAAGGTQTIRATPMDPKRPLPDGVVIPAKYFTALRDLAPGSYLAVLDRSPFWESGVSRLTELGSSHMVLGWPEGQR
ncbi:MAG TPA: hypothetical protein VFV78_08565 [Vicinamibacterales bacterium]|nr:hypothetical protein [Vicinamibacterales bacterium]